MGFLPVQDLSLSPCLYTVTWEGKPSPDNFYLMWIRLLVPALLHRAWDFPERTTAEVKRSTSLREGKRLASALSRSTWDAFPMTPERTLHIWVYNQCLDSRELTRWHKFQVTEQSLTLSNMVPTPLHLVLKTYPMAMALLKCHYFCSVLWILHYSPSPLSMRNIFQDPQQNAWHSR